MLRLNLLREDGTRAPQGAQTKSPGKTAPGSTPGTGDAGTSGKSAARAVLITLLALAAVGGAALLILKPEWKVYLKTESAAREAAAADSLRRLDALRADASRQVAGRQDRALGWLDHLETLFPYAGAGYALTMSSFTVDGTFVLRGTAETAEDASTLQEALVLIPGMELRESLAEERDESQGGGYTFHFAGTIARPETPDAPAGYDGDRIADSADLVAQWAILSETAREEGLSFSPPRPGAVVAAEPLRLRTFRLAGAGTAGDSATAAGLRNLLLAETNRRSPFGIQRLTLENRSGRPLVFLDIMAFTL